MLNPYEYGHLGDRIAVNDEMLRGNPQWLPDSWNNSKDFKTDD